MAAPVDIVKVSLSGVYQDPGGVNPGDLWEWAQVFHVRADVFTGGAVDPNKLTQLMNWKLSLYQGGGAVFTPVSSGMLCEERTAIHLNSGTVVTDNTPIFLRPGAGVDPLPAGCCILLFGRTGDLRRQTRKWIPGVRADLFLPGPNYYDTGENPIGTQLFTWCTALLAPANVGTVGQINDVAYSESEEVARDVTQVFLEKYPRTRGSRQLTAPSQTLLAFP